MKLDYCNDHVRKGKEIEACLAIRHDDGKVAKPREVWAEIERLRNVAQAAWMDIETAPKDGAVIDVWNSWHGCRVENVCWIDDMWLAQDAPTPDVNDITHWMPLPAAPNVELRKALK